MKRALLLMCLAAVTARAETGTASWYGAECAGRPMANGAGYCTVFSDVHRLKKCPAGAI